MPQTAPDSIVAQTDSTLAAAPLRPLPDALSLEPPSTYARPDSLGFTTVLFDSVAADTLPGIPHFVPIAVRDSLIEQARLDSIAAHPTLRPSIADVGMTPAHLSPNYINSGPLAALMTGVLVVAALCAPGLKRTLKSYRQSLWSVRGRRNAFDESSNTSAPMVALLALIFVIFGGVMLYNLPGLPRPSSFGGACMAMSLLGGYYIFQLCAYTLTGYAFASRGGCRKWLAGFAATQAYAGLALILPAFLLVAVPQWHNWLIILGLTIYFAARAIFIIRGCRIFYRNFSSILYFILYLCSLEIIPPAGIYLLLKYMLNISS